MTRWRVAEAGEPTGLASEGGALVVTLPRCYIACEPLLANEARRFGALRLTLGTLLRYAQMAGQKSVEAHALTFAAAEAGLRKLDRLDAGLALIEDARRHGPLTASASAGGLGRPGRIDWRRSEQSLAPVESAGNLLHPRLWRVAQRRDPEQPLVTLHRRAVPGMTAELGLGPSAAMPGAGEARRVLEQTAGRLFEDRQRRVHGLLRRWFRGAGAGTTRDAEARTLVAGTFHTIWERMLVVALGGSRSRQHGLGGRYQYPDGSSRKGLDLNPDLIVRTNGRLLVLDAKDYEPDGLPSTHDLTKQIAYRLLIWTSMDGTPLGDIGNAFLFPAVLAGAPVQLRAVHRVEGNPAACVVGLDVDFERVARAYIARRTDGDLLGQVAELVFRHQEPVHS